MSANPGEGRIAALYRHPVKSFTPEPLDHADLTAGAHFPGDRLYVVESGPSGFDPAAPTHIKKMKFAVLARMPRIAAVRTEWDAETGVLRARREGQPDFEGDLETEAGREAFAAWLEPALEDTPHLPFHVVRAPGAHRFMDTPASHVSIVNLASVRDLEARTGRAIDPLRFRANVYVEGWAPWAELEMTGATISVGGAVLEGVGRIDRCAATHVDPATGERDFELVGALRDLYGHIDCGQHTAVVQGGRLAVGDALTVS